MRILANPKITGARLRRASRLADGADALGFDATALALATWAEWRTVKRAGGDKGVHPDPSLRALTIRTLEQRLRIRAEIRGSRG